MYCHSCGIPLTQQLKYCNRCGALLIKSDDSVDIRRIQKRLDNYLDGLFWVTVIGLAVIVGGLVVLKKVGFPTWVWIAYLGLSSTAFLINFLVNLSSSLKIMKGSKEIATDREIETAQLDVIEIEQLPPAPSVVENTTRTLEPIIQKRC